MTKSRAALIILTAPKEMDTSGFWDYFFCKPMPEFQSHENDHEVRMAALAYLEHMLEKIQE